MPYDPQRHDRQSLRLQEYDYGQPGAYFVTICVENKHCLLGAIRSGCVRLNKYGRIVHDEWQRTPETRPDDFRSPSHTLGAIVRGFTGAATRRVNERRGTPGEPVWQRNYWERIIRGRRHLHTVRRYIARNPRQWHRDRHRAG
jgi:REP element-mobilizing transposase RayT